MKKNITKAQFNAVIFCMAQRAIQENKVDEFLKINVQKLNFKIHQQDIKF